MTNRLVIIGAPTSAGAYAPGQEKAPAALRAAGLVALLQARGVQVEDRSDIAGFRWQLDTANLRAMNAAAVACAARSTAASVSIALAEGAAVLVLGGDCTVELGTVAGAQVEPASCGLVYIDHDTDLNTPESTNDGALDWMGVAHMLGVEGAIPDLMQVAAKVPLLVPEQILFFAHSNVMPFERQLIDAHGIAEIRLAEVAADPAVAAAAAARWAQRFERLLVHLDVDVLDYRETPLAENTRREDGLRFDQLMAALRPLLLAPNWCALTITELNPDHGDADGATLRRFVEALVDVLASAPRLHGARVAPAGPDRARPSTNEHLENRIP